MLKEKDGWRRNLAQFWLEWFLLREGMRPHVKRWLKKPFDMHAFYNLFVESGRLGVEYLMGHIWGTLTLTQVVTLVLLIVVW